jgi:hypothetical protein
MCDIEQHGNRVTQRLVPFTHTLIMWYCVRNSAECLLLRTAVPCTLALSQTLAQMDKENTAMNIEQVKDELRKEVRALQLEN